MIEPTRQFELLEALAALSRRYPEWRIGQLVANVADWADRTIGDVEDADLLDAARRHLDQATAPVPDRVHA